MTRAIINLPLDKTGNNPENLTAHESYELKQLRDNVKVTTLKDGGFYRKGLRVYDLDYKELILGRDFILDYYHKDISALFGLDIYSLIVVIKDVKEDTIIVNAQMVGGDVAFSFSVIDDYTIFLADKEVHYVPNTGDYIGNEPVYGPGELVKLRWKLDTYQPFNNEIYKISRATLGFSTSAEDELRTHIRKEYQSFVDSFEDTMIDHVNDMDNPHDTTKAQVGLGLVNNFPIASMQEAIDMTIDNKYLTPKLVWESLDVNAITPVNEHIEMQGLDDPHEVTVEQIGALFKPEIDDMLVVKYNKQEVVSNSTTGLFRGQDRTYNNMVIEFKKNTSPLSFTKGYVHPTRMAGGTPTDTTVITSNGQRWTKWDDLISNIDLSAGDIVTASFSSSFNQSAAHNFIATNAAYRNLPNNSLVLYRLYHKYHSSYGNGGEHALYTWFTYASFKNSNGLWVAV